MLALLLCSAASAAAAEAEPPTIEDWLTIAETAGAPPIVRYCRAFGGGRYQHCEAVGGECPDSAAARCVGEGRLRPLNELAGPFEDEVQRHQERKVGDIALPSGLQP